MRITDPIRIGEGDDDKRQLWNLMFVFEICVAGFDSTRPASDFAHRAQCLELLEATIQGIHKVHWGGYTPTSARWVDDRTHGRHGAELVATVTFNLPIFDAGTLRATPNPVLSHPKPAPPA